MDTIFVVKFLKINPTLRIFKLQETIHQTITNDPPIIAKTSLLLIFLTHKVY